MISIHPIEAWSQAYDNETEQTMVSMPCTTQDEADSRAAYVLQRTVDKNTVLGTISGSSSDRAEMPRYISEVYNK